MGLIIIRKFGGQSSEIFGVRNCYLFILISFIRSLNLMGFPILSGFMSKDSILELLSSTVSIIFLLAFFVSCILTVLYTLRFLIICVIKFIKRFLQVNEKSNHGSIFLRLSMVIISVFLGILSFFIFGEFTLTYFFKDKILGLLLLIRVILFLFMLIREFFYKIR